MRESKNAVQAEEAPRRKVPMPKKEKVHREPLFHIVKRTDISRSKAILIRAAAIAAALLLCSLIMFLIGKVNPVDYFSSMLKGNFGTPNLIWANLYSVAILLCVAVALTPAFRMRFWNIGAEGQVLMGGLAATMCMMYAGGSVPLPVLYIMMTVASILAGAIWGGIPAIFKAQWNTNETLFTLMMNYVAIQLVSFFINIWVKSGSGVLKPMDQYGFPTLGNKWLLNILVVAVITVLIYVYLRYTKQGYEISVVGESENTARYVGINVKKVIIRTMLLSGALCGVAGLIIAGGMNHTISVGSAGGRGFTAIMVTWLAKFNPLFMVLTSILIVFLEAGSMQIKTDFRLANISEITTAIILFFIIGCEFFINYRIIFRRSEKEADGQ